MRITQVKTEILTSNFMRQMSSLGEKTATWEERYTAGASTTSMDSTCLALLLVAPLRPPLSFILNFYFYFFGYFITLSL